MLNNLIKSGGGTGPLKPGNLTKVKVPIPAVSPRDEEIILIFDFQTLDSCEARVFILLFL